MKAVAIRKTPRYSRRMKNMRKTATVMVLMAFTLLGVWILLFATRDRGQKMLPTEPITIIDARGERYVFTVELAVTPGEQQMGLMYRRSLAPDAGMLFVFPKPEIADFWMENTALPLDMLFIRKKGIVDSIARNAVPYSLANIFSAGPVIATLEVAAGATSRLDLQTGDKVLAHQFTAN